MWLLGESPLYALAVLLLPPHVLVRGATVHQLHRLAVSAAAAVAAASATSSGTFVAASIVSIAGCIIA